MVTPPPRSHADRSRSVRGGGGDRSTGVTPTGRALTFGRDELIVSKTDLRGHITYANETFLRLSGYSCDEVIGRPHSLIRHPQMPRGVFHLLWERIEAGHEVFAYINNLAVTGDHYWVLAHVTPSRNPGGRIDGYHSNRRRPEPAAVRTVEALYRTMLEAERPHTNARQAAAAGRAVLDREVARTGVDYDAYIWSVIESAKGAAA